MAKQETIIEQRIGNGIVSLVEYTLSDGSKVTDVSMSNREHGKHRQVLKLTCAGNQAEKIYDFIIDMANEDNLLDIC